MRFTNKTALITGGNSGIGFETARQMIAEGARVAITGRDAAKLDEAAKTLGGNALPIQADLDDPTAIAAVIAKVQAAYGKLDILFANAGISGPTTVGGTTLEDFERITRTNLTAVFLTVQAAVPLMDQGGAIVLNGSVLRDRGSPGTAAYAASKAGVTAIARVIAAELAPKGIRINTVIPGATRTPIWTRSNPANVTLDATEKAIAPAIPFGRFAEVAEVANAVLFLASDASSGMTAAEITVDGGFTGAPSGAPAFRRP